MVYESVPMKLTDSQLKKVSTAVKNGDSVTIQVSKKSMGSPGNIVLNLTNRQVTKLNGLQSSETRILLSKTQLKGVHVNSSPPANVKSSADLQFKVTGAQKDKIANELQKLMILNDVSESQFQDGEGIGSIFKLALPFVKKILPKVLGTLGLAAASGAVSGATHKATKGKGIRRVGGTINLNKSELEEMMKLGNACHCNKIVPANFVKKMNDDVKEMKGGFIGTLLAGLAGSLLPSLFSGNGLRRAGKGLRRAGNGLRRAGDTS